MAASLWRGAAPPAPHNASCLAPCASPSRPAARSAAASAASVCAWTGCAADAAASAEAAPAELPDILSQRPIQAARARAAPAQRVTLHRVQMTWGGDIGGRGLLGSDVTVSAVARESGAAASLPDAAAVNATYAMAPRGGTAPRRTSIRGRAPPPPATPASTCRDREENAALGSEDEHTAAERHSTAARVGKTSHSSARRAPATRDGGAAAPDGPRCSAANARPTAAGESDVHHIHTTLCEKQCLGAA